MFRPNEIISMFVVCMHKCVYTGLSCCITLVKQNSLINLVIQIWGTKLKYKYEKKNPVVWITLDPPPPQSHRVIKGLTTLFLFLFTFNSTDTAEIRNTDVTPGVCTDRLLLSSHLHPLSVLPKCLVSLSCMNSATSPACQPVRERTACTARWMWVKLEGILQCLCGCLHINPAVGRAQAQLPPAPGTSKGDRNDTGYTEEANFSCEFNLSSWRCNGGTWPVGVSGGWKAAEFC